MVSIYFLKQTHSFQNSGLRDEDDPLLHKQRHHKNRVSESATDQLETAAIKKLHVSSSNLKRVRQGTKWPPFCRHCYFSSSSSTVKPLV